jgi:glycerate dehydrogenase
VQHAIVFLDRESVSANVRKPNFPHSYKEYQSTWTPEEIVERLKDATIAIINKVPMRADTLKQLPKLKLIAVAATGTDVVDKAWCRENGVTVVNIRNYAFNTVPEHVMALIFALRRNLLAYVADVRAVLMRMAEGFIILSSFAPIMFLVSGVSGVWSVMTSLSR